MSKLILDDSARITPEMSHLCQPYVAFAACASSYACLTAVVAFAGTVGVKESMVQVLQYVLHRST